MMSVLPAFTVYIVALTVAGNISAGTVTLSSQLDFSDLVLAPSSGTLEVLSTATPELHLSSFTSMDTQPGVLSGAGGPGEEADFVFSFILQPDNQHQVGDEGNVQFSFLAKGTVEQTPNLPQMVDGGDAILVTDLLGTGGAPDVGDWYQRLDAYYYGENAHSDFLWTGFDVTISFGYVYNFTVGGSVQTSEIYDPALSIPDSLGPSAPLYALGLLFWFGHKLRYEQRSES